jgi:hypothetical protein
MANPRAAVSPNSEIKEIHTQRRNNRRASCSVNVSCRVGGDVTLFRGIEGFDMGGTASSLL